MYECLECSKKKCLNYRHSINGLVTTTYNNQLRYSKIRKHPKPSYTKEELKQWFIGQPKFQDMYNNWIASGYDKWEKPSVDRIDDYLPYTIDNIQLMTWKENHKKGDYCQLNGLNNKNSKSVLQYDTEGNFIKEYYSIAQAGRENNIFGSNISYACMGKFKTMGGFIWKYKE